MEISKFIKFSFILILFITINSCVEDTSEPQVTGSFEVVFEKEALPIEVNIINSIKNATEYKWSFPGGTPSYSTSKNPGTIIYNERGAYTITLKASNKDSRIEYPQTINLFEDINIDFDIELSYENGIAILHFNNETVGATDYHWSCESPGVYQESSEFEPTNIRYDETGEYKVILKAWNDFETQSDTQIVRVNIPIEYAYFDFELSSYNPPATLDITSLSTNAPFLKWTFEGGNPGSSTEMHPKDIDYETGGEYQIKLEASNFDSTVTVIKSFYLSTGEIESFTDITLGGIDKETTTGIAFSTKTGQVYNSTHYTNENGNAIDITFLGMDGMRFFTSPDNVDTWSMTEIPNATHTDFINYISGSSINFTVEMFDNMTNDTPLKDLEITDDGESFPTNSDPFIILFKNEQGKKGAIKVTSLQTGSDGFILFDLKIQK